jgi:peptide/nickel transport system substrate-binding protein
MDFIKKKIGKEESRQAVIDKRLVYSLSRAKIPSLKQIKYIKKFLSIRELWILRISFLIFALSLFFLGGRFYLNHLQVVPVKGGEYVEGLIGSPQYINPLYASYSDVDSDISSLIFSSLLKRNKDGQLINDLAINYEISKDNKAYTFQLRTDAKWHNNTPVTVDDVMFTFNIIKDGRYNSPLRKSFIGVNIEKVNESTVRFVLAEPYAAFLDLLTFGILPQDLWYQILPNAAGLAELNLKPIGSGPYKFKSLTKDKTGQIKSYNLVINEDYYGKQAHIEKLSFVFFPNFEEALQALNGGIVDGISYLPKQLEEDLVAQDSLNIHRLNLPQLTAIFFNQGNNSFLKEKSVRQALALAINKNKIIEDVFSGDARLVDGPILPDSFAYNQNIKKYSYNKEEAIKLLEDAGWKEVEITEDDLSKAEANKDSEDEKEKQAAEIKLMLGAGKWRNKDNKFLVIKLTAVDREDNLRVVEHVKRFWEEIGVRTNIELITDSQVELEVIKPRNFEALFYSQILGSDPDLYAFWHSSQTGEAGINLSNYANKEVDQLLEDARIISDRDKRKEKYTKFQEIITEDLPAIFLYSPTYTYIQSKRVKGFDLKNIFIPKDRFSNISDWYIKTGKKLIWK